jgi:hypothetical protein
MNVMSAALSLRSGLGIGIVILGLALSERVIESSIVRSMEQVRLGWVARPAPPAQEVPAR